MRVCESAVELFVEFEEFLAFDGLVAVGVDLAHEVLRLLLGEVGAAQALVHQLHHLVLVQAVVAVLVVLLEQLVDGHTQLALRQLRPRALGVGLLALLPPLLLAQAASH
jgi:hypothetical protein